VNAKAILLSHPTTFICLLPVTIALVLHHLLGLSDALNIPTPPGEREAHLYNWLMVALFFSGVVAFVLHSFFLAYRGGRWVAAKLVFLAVYWYLFIMIR
jgi:hypothetical protein